MIFVKISQNFIKSSLKFCFFSQISVHSLLHVWGYFYIDKENIKIYLKCSLFIKNPSLFSNPRINPACPNKEPQTGITRGHSYSLHSISAVLQHLPSTSGLATSQCHGSAGAQW